MIRILAKLSDLCLTIMVVVMIIIMYQDIKQIKEQVNEVICVALEMEETWVEQAE